MRVRASGRDLPPSRCDLRSRAAISLPPDAISRYLRAWFIESSITVSDALLHAISRPPDAISGYLRAWFIESSITVSDALLHAIWKPFMTAIAEMPFQSCLSTTCRAS